MIRRPAYKGRQISRSRGQALVEFALVAPIFFLILFSIIDFGRYVYYVQILNNAAREGARYAIVHGSNGMPSSGPPAPGFTSSDPSSTNVKAVARRQAIGVVGSTAVLRIDALYPDDYNRRGDRVTVTVQYDFKSIIPIVPLPPILITGESTLVINN
jgi:Flp pilus assembly protein TadG